VTTSKVGFFLIIIASILIISGCKKDNFHPVPDVTIDFYIDLTDPEFLNLTVETGYALINSATNNWGYLSAGFDNNGIIVYHSMGDEFLAYDRTCPHDYALSGLSIAVDVDGVYAECPECKSTWALPSFGAPSAGPSRYPLKEYRTSFDGRFVHVFNR
jgi:nitrite reductase/ring-hydroxylating ferredoxin subunit